MKAKILLKIILILICATTLFSCASNENMTTAKDVNLQKYMGTWYEIARTDNPFQRGTFNAVANYTLKENGEVTVVNQASDESGNAKVSKATAYAPNENDYSRLRVAFFYPFYGDYIILALDKDYKWSLVSGSDYEYLWLLAREKPISKETFRQIQLETQNQPAQVQDFLKSIKTE